MTFTQARDAIRNLYLANQLIREENDRVGVTLMHPRQNRIMVFRQEAL